MKNRDIIIIGIQPWDINIGSNCKNIALEFSKENRVLYVNHPLDRWTYLRKSNNPINKGRANALKESKISLTKINENLFVFNPKVVFEPVNSIPNKPIFNFFNKLNARRLANEINKAIKYLEFENYILFNDSQMFVGLHMKSLLKPEFYFYYIRDNLVESIHPYWNTHGKRIEPLTIKTADAVVTNSEYYTEYARNFNSNSFMIGQGCDTAKFDFLNANLEIPVEMSSIPKPIIGYVGALTIKRIDIELLAFISQNLPSWNIVLVGPEDDTFKNSHLHSLSNIYFLGVKEESTIPNYIYGFDVCINPQLLNKATIGNYPRKMDEYLATGKPVVASWTKAMEYFEDYVYLAHNHEEYITLIPKALSENTYEKMLKRRNFAVSHTWENNVNKIVEIYNSIRSTTK